MMDISSLINSHQQQRRRSSLFTSITNSADDWQSGSSLTIMRSISPELRNTPSLLLPRLTPNRRISISPLPSLGHRFADLIPPGPSPANTTRPLTIRLRLPNNNSNVSAEKAEEAADGLHLLASLALRHPASTEATTRQPSPHQNPVKIPVEVPAPTIKRGKKNGHSCPDCGSIFPSRSRLRRHELMHTGARPWTCDWPGCGRSFGRKDNMMQHQRTHMANQKNGRPSSNQQPQHSGEEGHSSLSDK